MASWRKVFARMRESRNPCNFAFEDCARVLEHLGFTELPNSGTSHRKFVLRRDGEPPIIVPMVKPGAGPVKKWYVLDMLETLEQAGLFPKGTNDEHEE